MLSLFYFLFFFSLARSVIVPDPLFHLVQQVQVLLMAAEA